MSILPQINAQLTEVTGAPRLRSSYSTPTGDPTSKWAGRVGVFLSANRTLSSDSSGRDDVTQRTVWLPKVTELEIGDVLEVSYGGADYSWTVAGVTEIGAGVELYPYYQATVEVS